MIHSFDSFFIRIAFIAFLSSLLFLCQSLQAQSSIDKPNVLIIMIDDLNDCLQGWGGHAQALSPNIHRLAKTAASFRQAYTNAPMCGPSRASLFTGIYPHHSGNFFQAPWYKKETLSNTRTIMEQFKLHGYHVMGSGKILHHNQDHLWSHFEHPADYSPSPFDGEKRVPHPDVPAPFYDIGWVDGSLGPFINLEGRKSPEGKPLSWTTGNPNTGFSPMRYISDEDRDPTPDERNARWAAETIANLSSNPLDQPFFLAVGFLRPHTPLVAPQKYFDLFLLDELEVAVNKPGDEDDSHLTVAYQGDVFTLRMGKKMFHEISEAYGSVELGIKKWTQAYLACVAAVDDNVGEVMNALDASPFAKNTIVVLASDHGFHMGEKEYLYKNSLWEESTRVPLIMRVPGISKAGSHIQQTVSLIDIYPTLLDLCDLPTETAKNEKGMSPQGSSLRSLLEGAKGTKWQGALAALTVVYAGSASKDDPRLQHYAIRSNRYRYILYNNGMEELYDHQKDPYEWNNLAIKPSKKDRRRLKKARSLLKKMVYPYKLRGFEQVQEL